MNDRIPLLLSFYRTLGWMLEMHQRTGRSMKAELDPHPRRNIQVDSVASLS